MPEPRPVTEQTLRSWPLPAPGDDKEARGRVLVLGGTGTTPGAVLLAAEAALRAGAGKLAVATAAGVSAHVAVMLPEALVQGLAETPDGHIDPAAAPGLLQTVGDDDTVLVGSGFVDPRRSTELLADLLPGLRGTVVIDALASAFVTEDPERLATLPASFVLSLNPGEVRKTLRREDGDADPVADAAELASRTGAVVLCGGSDKVVAGPDGALWRVGDGGPGLGVSGSGDVQAGLVTGLLARGAEPAQAAVWGAFLHGRAGDRLAERVGTVGFLAREVAGEVPAILSRLS